MTMMKILRRGVALCMALALVVVPGVLSTADQIATGKTADKPSGAEDCMIAAWDTVNKTVDAEGRTVVDYLKGDALIRREIYVADGKIEVWIVGADGQTLELSGTIDPIPSTSDRTATKYVDEKGFTVVDTFENGFLYSRETFDPTTGEHVYTIYDKDGNPYDSKTWNDGSTAVDPNAAYDKVDTYPTEDGQGKIADFYKDGTLVRREFYFPDRMEVYVLDANGNLVLDESQSQVFPTAAPQPWDDATKSIDKDGNTVVDYLKDGLVIRREVYKTGGGMEVYELDAAGNLILTVTD